MRRGRELPPAASAANVFREQVRTALHGWGGEYWWYAALFPVAVLLMWATLGPPAFLEAVLDAAGEGVVGGGPGTGYLGWGFLVAMWLAFMLPSVVWQPRGMPNMWKAAEGWEAARSWRAGGMAHPVDHRMHDLLRTAGGALWMLSVAWATLGFGASLEWMASGAGPGLSAPEWAGLAGAPLVVYLTAVAALIGKGRVTRGSAGVIIAILLLGFGGGAVPGGDAVAELLLWGDVGLVSAVLGRSPLATLLWSAVAGALVWWQTGRLPHGRRKNEETVRGGTAPAARPLRAPARMTETAPPSGRLPPRPPWLSVLREQLRTFGDGVSGVWLASIAFGLPIIGGVMLDGVWLHDPRTWGGVLDQPLAAVHGLAVVVAAYFPVLDSARLVPSAMGGIGAPPVSRRSWVLSRLTLLVAPAFAILLLGHLALGLGAWLGGPAGMLGGQGLLHAAGLVLAAGLFGGIVTTISDRPFVAAFTSMVAFVVVPPLISMTLLVLPPTREAAGSAYASLHLEGVLQGEPTAAATLFLLGWIALLVPVLWLSAGRRPGSGTRAASAGTAS